MTTLQPDIELTPAQASRLLTAWRGRPVRCTGLRRLSGGMVNSVFRLDLDESPHHVVVKLHDAGGDDFEREAAALTYLRERTDCPVPAVLLHDGGETVVPHAFLLLEHVPGVCADHLDLTAAERSDLDGRLAAILAALHDHTGDRWGRVGEPTGTATWPAVVAARLAEERARPTVTERLRADVLDRVDAAIAVAPELLDDPGVPRLVHGDVWDGNLLVRRTGSRWEVAALLDPDLQFADPEIELAYLEVFDNPRPALRAAYEARHPLRAGYERRRLVHWLHTALVHVALFEESYFRDFTARTADGILAAASSGPA